MDQTNIQNENSDTKCCIDFCTQAMDANGQQVNNSYKCGQPAFTSSELYNIEKRRRQFTRRSSIFAIN